ncbi:MAG: hypothetical protein F4210_03960 [Holophagales bacterium]|nr:hypothetical protein [Holophagales bacterium]MYF94660.1 hypothetical protein [Holophagales bacterium]
MKQIIPFALLAAALPALLAAQTTGSVECPRCQVAPYFAGEGGFVGETAGLDGVTEVEFFLNCGATTISVQVQPDSNGIVREALNSANGRNCPGGARGTLEVDNLKPGGWYWINDDQNSAVAAFFPKEAVDNQQIDVTDPGGVEIETPSGGIATWVKHVPTGRVGIIPRIVPTRPIPGCSGMVGEDSAGDCLLGTSDDWRLTVSPSEVIRPLGTDPGKPATIRLVGENFITTRMLSARGEIEHHASVTGIQFSVDGGEPTSEQEEGVLKWTVTVGADDNRCLPANNDPDRLNEQTVTFSIAAMDGAIPGLGDDGLETTVTVNCPDDSAAAAAATDLVPENPFPVD